MSTDKKFLKEKEGEREETGREARSPQEYIFLSTTHPNNQRNTLIMTFHIISSEMEEADRYGHCIGQCQHFTTSRKVELP